MDSPIDFKVGDNIAISPKSSLYEHKYVSQVQWANDKEFFISIPVHEGRIIPLSAGTRVIIYTEQGNLESEILSRKFGHERGLLLAKPGTIFRGKRPCQKKRDTKVITITSGKGGVGKSSLAINLAITLSMQGERVCLVDADLGMANLDILLQLTPKYNLTHIFQDNKDIFEVIVEGPEDTLIIPGGSGWESVSNLRDYQFNRLTKAFNKLDEYTDLILFDTGAGINQNVINFLLSSDEVILVTTPEPHAITDAYAMIKVILAHDSELPIKLLINKAKDQKEAKDISDNIVSCAKQFLGASIEYVGFVQENNAFSQSVKTQTPIIQKWPKSKTSVEIQQIARDLLGKTNTESFSGLKGFIKKLSRLVSK